MPTGVSRRRLLSLAASGPLLQATSSYTRAGPTKAVALDGFAVFDSRVITARVEELLPGKSPEFTAIWRTRQFEYTWLRTMMGAYADFWSITEDALIYSAKTLKVELTRPRREHLMHGFSELRPWPDAPAALRKLHSSGVRLVLLSNFTLAMLNSAVASSGLQDLFEPHLSTDQVRAYKPDPRAYRMAVDALKLAREEIVFAAFSAWDGAGAKAFGFPTFWVNRTGAPLEELGFTPDGIGANLNDLASFLGG
jgi:2-haloacid dehalogenase